MVMGNLVSMDIGEAVFTAALISITAFVAISALSRLFPIRVEYVQVIPGAVDYQYPVQYY